VTQPNQLTAAREGPHVEASFDNRVVAEARRRADLLRLTGNATAADALDDLVDRLSQEGSLAWLGWAPIEGVD
jgi:hypothetical protein